ncbi:hypothetical protein [Metasolibacillus meyeri]|uniref:hypothetical protein n=1 Tax=Metasolibacillus meyeri TaxID=1071052 RepID=UPI000D3235EB|nr:hypothetical protein [Metasolibacillus meyeri]
MQKRLNLPMLAIPIILVVIFLMTNQKAPTTTVQDGSSLEQTLQEMAGVGQVKVYVHYEQQGEAIFSDYFRAKEGRVTGILIVSEGAVEPTVQRELLQVVSRVMEIPTHRIMIVPMRNKGDGE